MSRNIQSRLSAPLILWVLCCGLSFNVRAQSGEAPLTSRELVRRLYQLPAHPEKRDEIVEEIRKRGIGFPLTDGLRSLVATKSGNDALLRRTLEEAERRRLNPAASALPSEAEGREILSRTRAATLAAAEAMPDFVVKQLITRSYALGSSGNWKARDRLAIAVSYRAGAGEEYKVLAVNGMPPNVDFKEGRGYEQLGGTTSTGEYVSMLAQLFAEERQASFKMVDTDLLRGRRTVVYEYEVKRPFSLLRIKDGALEVRAGYHGRVWIDRENYRVLRFEEIADLPAEVPAGFHIIAARGLIDYDWVEINERQYLLPSRAEIILTSGRNDQSVQSRNEIRFRDYQKFGTDVKIIEDVEFEDDQDGKKP
ncbi:MAG TPA: hypothetical protein VD966_04425 [Pyrinomonadaceae bacterium]|nr:hypothetical protein [Pyrinomonadaceae bacterium]